MKALREETHRSFWAGGSTGYRGAMTTASLLDQLRVLVASAPVGGQLTLSRDWLADRLSGLELASERPAVQTPVPLVPGALYTTREAEVATRRSRRHLRRYGVPVVRDGRRRTLYRGEDLIAHIERHLVTTAQRQTGRTSRAPAPQLGGRPGACFSPGGR